VRDIVRDGAVGDGGGAAVIRVCFAVDAPFLGGAELYVSRLAGALDPARVRSMVLMKSDAPDPALRAWADGLRARGVPVIEAPMRLPFVPSDAVGIWRGIEAHAPHIVHVNAPGPYDGQTGLLLPIARAAGARTVVTEHLPMVAPLWKRAVLKRAAYRALDVAVTMTQANADYLREYQRVPSSRVRVVKNGIPAAFGAGAERGAKRRWALGLRDSSVVVVYLGNILPHKGLRRLIEAIARTASRNVVHLLVVGAGPDEAACRQLANDRGLAARTLFLGRRGADEIEELLAAADVLALPSTIEGLPYVILEAMASRLPVVAGRVYGVPEVVDNGVTGLLVDPVDIDAIASALDTLAADPALRRAMGDAGRARFEREFTLERQALTMQSIYETLVRGRGGRDGRTP
jgi:glycosyltransferase involved in cell wall biosynthesis